MKVFKILLFSLCCISAHYSMSMNTNRKFYQQDRIWVKFDPKVYEICSNFNWERKNIEGKKVTFISRNELQQNNIEEVIDAFIQLPCVKNIERSSDNQSIEVTFNQDGCQKILLE